MTVGVLGAGQLGQMLALAGAPLGLKLRFLDHTPNAPAGQVAEQIVGEFQDAAALDRFAAGLDVATLEFENVPVEAVERLAKRVPTFPPAAALRTAQDRVLEKACFEAMKIATTRWAAVEGRSALAGAVEKIGVPCVLKTRRLGYDGKGQSVIREKSAAALDCAWSDVAGQPSIVEELVAFDREVSIIGVRGRDGACEFYPLIENRHAGGILRESRMSETPPPQVLQREAESACRAVLERFGYVGVLTIEFFEREGHLIANEMAPRVHNSGHWTIEGATVSQFEMHLRAVCGMKLPAPRVVGASIMHNIIGAAPSLDLLRAVPGARVHMYGKQERPGRKLGHVTLTGDSLRAIEPAAARVRLLLDPPGQKK